MYLHQTSLEIAHHQHADRLALAHKDHLIAEARAGHPKAAREIKLLLAVHAIARRVTAIHLTVPGRRVACAASDVH